MNLETLENGFYVKAKICGVSSRTVLSKKTGEEFVFHSLVIETSMTAQKQYIQLGKKLLEKGIVKSLSDERMKGRVCLIPIFYKHNGEYLSINYAGENMPIFIQPLAKSA